MTKTLAFDDWRQLEAGEAARQVHEGLARLSAGQRRAMMAWVLPEAELAARIARARSERRALGGVPCVVKDLFDLAGVDTRAGSVFLPEVRPTPSDDSALVKWLGTVGAAVAGKTHLHEFAYGITGENPHHGDVEHPRFPGRTAGGSSSGSAAAVAAGVVPLAFGTDTAGSVRVPAAFCGLWGFRMMPRHAWIEDAFPLAPSFDTAGWFTGNARDMEDVLRVADLGAGNDGARRGGAWLEPEFGAVEPELAEAQRAAARRIAEPLPERIAAGLRAAFAEAPGIFAAIRAPEAWEVHAAWAERMRERYDPAVYARVVAGREVGRAAQAAAWVAREKLHDALAAVWAEFDFLVMPATPCVAPTKAECTQATRERIFALTTPASVAGVPVLTVPVGLPGGLSTGLQVLAPTVASGAWERVLAEWR